MSSAIALDMDTAQLQQMYRIIGEHSKQETLACGSLWREV